MKKKRIKEIVIWSIVVVTAVILASCVTKFMSYLKIRDAQASAGQMIPENFTATLPLITDEKGRFMIEAEASNGVEGLFILDTHANSMMREDSLRQGETQSWGYWPMNVRNYYGQSFKTELIRMPYINIGGATIDNTLWSAKVKEDSIYSIMHHPVIGKDILQLMCWNFDTDKDSVTICSTYNSQSMADKLSAYTKYEDGLSWEQVEVSFPKAEVSEKFIFDIGFGGRYLSVNKKIFKKLKKVYKPNHERKGDVDEYTFPAVKCELAGSTITIPVVYYSDINTNMIGVRMMELFNFCIFSHKDKDELIVDLYLKRNDKPVKPLPDNASR